MNHMSRASREAMITALAGLVDPLKRSLIGSSEVVLHDLSKMPNSIVAISGHLTSRNIGDPATEALLRAWREGTMQTRIGYESTSPKGGPCALPPSSSRTLTARSPPYAQTPMSLSGRSP